MKAGSATKRGEVFFDDAIVRISGTDLQRVTDNAGRFRFANIASGNHNIDVLYVGADPISTSVWVKKNETVFSQIKIGEKVEPIQNVIVVGQTADVLSAINKMRAADNIVSIVTSDAIGQFSDENVSEALHGLPVASAIRLFCALCQPAKVYTGNSASKQYCRRKCPLHFLGHHHQAIG